MFCQLSLFWAIKWIWKEAFLDLLSTDLPGRRKNHENPPPLQPLPGPGLQQKMQRIQTKKASRLCLKCDGTRAEIRFRLSAKRTSPFKWAGTSLQSTTGSRGVRISASNVGYTTFRGSVKGTGYPLHSPVSPSLTLPCVTVCHHNSTGLYLPLDHYTYSVI